MVGMAERLQSIEGQLNEIKALLHQVHHNLRGADGRLWHARSRRAPGSRRHPPAGETEMNANAGLNVAGLDLAAIPDRIQSEVQRAIQRSIKGVEYFSSLGAVARLDAKGHPARSRHHEPLSLPPDGR